MKRTKKSLFAIITTMMLVVAMIPNMVFANENVAYIGETGYASVDAAVAEVPNDNTQKTIVLAKDYTGQGVEVKDGQNIVFDLNGHTWDITETVGSAGTETNGLQLLKGSTVTIKNGTLTSSTAKILIQKYCDLTLENVKIDGTKLQGAKYVLSNNNGNTTIGSGTEIVAADDGVAFDVYFWKSYYPDGVTVIVEDGAEIKGKIEYAKSDEPDSSNVEARQKAKLKITGGTIEGEITDLVIDSDGVGNIEITGGEFSNYNTIVDYIAEDAKLIINYKNKLNDAPSVAVIPSGHDPINNGALYKSGNFYFFNEEEFNAFNEEYLEKSATVEQVAYLVAFNVVYPDRTFDNDKTEYLTIPKENNGIEEHLKNMEIQLPNLSADGYNFIGWYAVEPNYNVTEDGGVSKIYKLKYTEKVNMTSKVTKDAEYFAAWEPIATSIDEPKEKPVDEPKEKPVDENNPNTGDSSNMGLWIALMALAVVGGTGTVLFRRKNAAK